MEFRMRPAIALTYFWLFVSAVSVAVLTNKEGLDTGYYLYTKCKLARHEATRSNENCISAFVEAQSNSRENLKERWPIYIWIVSSPIILLWVCVGVTHYSRLTLPGSPPY